MKTKELMQNNMTNGRLQWDSHQRSKCGIVNEPLAHPPFTIKYIISVNKGLLSLWSLKGFHGRVGAKKLTYEITEN